MVTIIQLLCCREINACLTITQDHTMSFKKCDFMELTELKHSTFNPEQSPLDDNIFNLYYLSHSSDSN